MRILVTGATGFVGRAVVARLKTDGHEVVTAARRHGAGDVFVGDIGPETDWSNALKNIDAVMHLAARVHVVREHEKDPMAAFWFVNVDGTRQLAEACVKAGVKRLVFCSSVKAMAERSLPGHPLTEADTPAPETDYGLSKLEAENLLLEISARTGLEVVNVRPPLVHGPGARGNFLSLLRLCAMRLPLPVKSIANRRSFLHVDNLADALVLCATHPAAAGETFLVCDGQAFSTPELMEILGRGMGRGQRLFPFPPALLHGGLRLLGKGEVYEKLCGNLELDDTHLRQTLGWIPPIGPEEGLLATAKWFAEKRL